MYNKKLLLNVLNDLNKTKAPARKKDIEYVSPDSVDPTLETPQMKKGGSKKFSKHLGATNRLFKKNPLFKKPNYKSKTYDPQAMYFEDGGYVEVELTPEEIEEYRKGGYIVEDISVPSLNTFAGGGEPGTYILDGYKYKKDNGGKWSYESGQPIDDGTLIAKLDQQAKLVGTPAITQAPINTKILTSKLPAEKKTFKAPKSDTFKSETLQKVASKTVPQTDQEFTNVVEAQVDYDNKKHFLAQNALDKNYDSIAYSAAQELQKKNPKLTFDQALELAKQDNKLLIQKALETTVTNDPALIQKQAQQQGYSTPVKEATVKALDLNDPNHVEMDGRMPQTAGEYLQRGADILFNPLDAIHYGMSPTEEMPMNMYEYEKAKQQIGYEDGADKNAINEGIDFASWFTGAGQVAQGVKMLRGTGEAVYNAIQDPSLASAGNAALNVGFNAMAMNPLTRFIGGKSAILNPSTRYAGYAKLPGNTEVMYGNPYLQDAKAIVDLPGFKLAKGNVPKGSVPAVNNPYAFNTATTALGLTENAGKSLLSTVSQPHVITESPLTVATPITSGRKPVALEELAANENSARASSYGDNFDDIISRDDNEIVSNVINDVRERKIGLWQTPEGQRRLQKMIDNTPSLKGQTPETMIEGIGKMMNVNNTYDTLLKDRDALNKELEQLDIFHNEGQLSKTEYFDKVTEIENKLNDIEAAIPRAQDIITENSGHYNSKNAMAINPNSWTADDISRVTSHELGHFLGIYGPEEILPTYLDDRLKDLDLITDTSKQLPIPGFNKSDKSAAHVSLGADRGDYLQVSKDYFNQGSEGTERVPFIAEIREDMLQNGIIDSEYDKITPKMLQQHYNKYKSITEDKYPLRAYDIIKDKPKNFKILSDVLNDLPTVVGAASLVDSAMSDDESNVSEAGIGAILMAFGKKPNLKLPKKAIRIGKQIATKGYSSLSGAGKKIANEWFDVKKLTEAGKSALGKTGELLNKGAEKFVKTNEKIFKAPFKGIDAVSNLVTKPVIDRLGKKAGSKFVAKVKELTDVPTKENLAKLAEYEKASSVYDYYLRPITKVDTYTSTRYNNLTGNTRVSFKQPDMIHFFSKKDYVDQVNKYNIKLQAVQNYVKGSNLDDGEIKLILGDMSKKDILDQKPILVDEADVNAYYDKQPSEDNLSDFEYLDESYDYYSPENQIPPPPEEIYIDPVQISFAPTQNLSQSANSSQGSEAFFDAPIYNGDPDQLINSLEEFRNSLPTGNAAYQITRAEIDELESLREDLWWHLPQDSPRAAEVLRLQDILDEELGTLAEMPDLVGEPVESSSEYVSGSYRPDYPPEGISRVPPPPGEQNISFNRDAAQYFTPSYEQYAEAMGFSTPSTSAPDTAQGFGYDEYLNAVRDANNIENAESQNIPNWVENNNTPYRPLSGLGTDIRNIRRGVQEKRLPVNEGITNSEKNNVVKLTPTFYANMHESPREALAYVSNTLNRGLQNGEIGKIYTGSTNTSHDSYLIQMDYIFKNAGKDGISEPIFLGYEPMNDSGYLSKLGIDNKDILKKINDHLNKLQKKTGKNLNLDQVAPKIEHGNIFLPHYGVKKIGEITGKLKKKKEGGTANDYIEIEIPEHEIQNYIEQGYRVEPVYDTPVMAGGGTPSELWEQYTGTPWSEAKKQGLTDGSYDKNIELAKKLQAGQFGEPKTSTQNTVNADAQYNSMVRQMVKQGASLDDLVRQRVGTREGLMMRFPELANVQKTTTNYKTPVSSKPVANTKTTIPRQKGKGTTIMEQLGMLKQTLTPTYNKAKSAGTKAYTSWVNEQAKLAEKERVQKTAIKKEVPSGLEAGRNYINELQKRGVTKNVATPINSKVMFDSKKPFQNNTLEALQRFTQPTSKPVAQQKQAIEPYDMEALRAKLTQPNNVGAPSLTRKQSEQPLGNNTPSLQNWNGRAVSNENTPLDLPIVDKYPNVNPYMTKPVKTLSKQRFVSKDLENEIYGRQESDNKKYGKFDKKGNAIMNRTDVKRNKDSEAFFANIAKPNSVIIDIGSALGNSNATLAGVSVWELTQNPNIKQKNIKVIGTDIPEQVQNFKKHVKNKQAYGIDYAEVPLSFNTPVDSILKSKKLNDKKDVYLRAANSIDLLMNKTQTKEHFDHIAKTLLDKNVTYVFNNVILFKPAGESTFIKLGNLNNAAFDHKTSAWKTNESREPYKLLNMK